ncbi:MAG: hypothetical protein K5657_01950 [Desulfovibrio sp.]|nr:hypothetical protein [Desulfovibrio sp.]
MNGISNNLQAGNQVQNASQNQQVPGNLQQKYNNVTQQQNFENLQTNHGGSKVARAFAIIGGILSLAGITAITLATCGIGTAAVFFGGLAATTGGLTILSGALGYSSGSDSTLNQGKNNKVANHSNNNPVMHQDNIVQGQLLNKEKNINTKNTLQILKKVTKDNALEEFPKFLNNISSKVKNFEQGEIKNYLRMYLTKGSDKDRETCRNALHSILIKIWLNKKTISETYSKEDKAKTDIMRDAINDLIYEPQIKDMFNEKFNEDKGQYYFVLKK